MTDNDLNEFFKTDEQFDTALGNISELFKQIAMQTLRNDSEEEDECDLLW